MSGEGVRTLTASDIADLVGGVLAGDGAATVQALAPLDRATSADLSFLANARYSSLYQQTKAAAVLIAPEFEGMPTTAAAFRSNSRVPRKSGPRSPWPMPKAAA